MIIGTIVNTCAVVVGSAVGLIIKKSLPEDIKNRFFEIVGLFTIILGLKMAITMKNPIALIIGLLVGWLIGKLLKLDKNFRKIGFIFGKFSRDGSLFSEGFTTAFVLFCAGSLTIIGALDEGLRGDPTLLFMKSVMDGVSSVILSSVYGIGVMFAAVPLFLFQSSITLSASFSKLFLLPPVINDINSTGGVLVLAIGIELLFRKKLSVIELLPSLVVVPLISALF